MSAHTPGPWHIDDGAEQPIVRAHDGIRVAVVTGSATIPTHGRRNGHANARVIAAAPELLEALKWVVGQDMLKYTRRIIGQNDAWCDGIDRVHAAIRKAECQS